jgi:hypothetical protein
MFMFWRYVLLNASANSAMASNMDLENPPVVPARVELPILKRPESAHTGRGISGRCEAAGDNSEKPVEKFLRRSESGGPILRTEICTRPAAVGRNKPA